MSAPERHLVLELQPTSSYDPDALAAAIRPFPCPPSFSDSEASEKAFLRKSKGWRDVRGLFGYSQESAYKDLYIYFDAADRKSPLNVAATQAFKCYGLDGAQALNWDRIHGSVIITRVDPPTMGQSMKSATPAQGIVAMPKTLSVDELVGTLMFFQDKDAQRVAVHRDAQRMQAQISGGSRKVNGIGGLGHYVSPAGDVTEAQQERDARTCMNCKKTAAISVTVKKCSQCRNAVYCSRECQKDHWKVHKKECASMAMQ